MFLLGLQMHYDIINNANAHMEGGRGNQRKDYEEEGENSQLLRERTKHANKSWDEHEKKDIE